MSVFYAICDIAQAKTAETYENAIRLSICSHPVTVTARSPYNFIFNLIMVPVFV